MRQQALVVPDKAQRVAQFHKSTLHALQELVERVYHRRGFGRHIGADGLQAVGIAAVQFVGQPVQRLHAAAHRPHQQPQHQRQGD